MDRIELLNKMQILWEAGWEHTLFGWEHPMRVGYHTLTDALEIERGRNQPQTL